MESLIIFFSFKEHANPGIKDNFLVSDKMYGNIAKFYSTVNTRLSCPNICLEIKTLHLSAFHDASVLYLLLWL